MATRPIPHPDYPADFTSRDFPDDLLAMTENDLLSKHQLDVQTLLGTGRLSVDLALFHTAQGILSIAELLTDRLRYNFSERDRIRRERNNFWLRLTEARREIDRITAERDAHVRDIGILRGHLDRIRRERNQAGHANAILIRERNEAQIQSTGTLAQYNLVFGQLGQINMQLAHANNRVRFGIQTLGRLRNRLFQQIAALRIQVQWFRIRQLNPPPPPLNNILPETIWLPLR